MRHPQIMLEGTGATVSRWLAQKLNGGGDLPPCSMKVAEALGTQLHRGHDVSSVELPFALSQMVDSPIYWELEEATAVALIETDPGVMPDLRGFRLPHPAIWVGMPPLFSLWDTTTGAHAIEGFYLVEDWLPHRVELFKAANISLDRLTESLSPDELQRVSVHLQHPKAGINLYRSVLVIGVGESRNGAVRSQVKEIVGTDLVALDHVGRDDTLLSFWVYPEDPGRHPMPPRDSGDADLQRLVTNLLMALQEKYISQKVVVPVRPKSPKKVKRALRKGVTFDPFTVLRLAPSTETAKTSGRRGSPSQSKGRIIRGYWNHLWVKRENVGERKMLGEREGKASRLFKVRVWIKPQIIGNPTPQTTLVRK